MATATIMKKNRTVVPGVRSRRREVNRNLREEGDEKSRIVCFPRVALAIAIVQYLIRTWAAPLFLSGNLKNSIYLS